MQPIRAYGMRDTVSLSQQNDNDRIVFVTSSV
jgi:hypothetical protein